MARRSIGKPRFYADILQYLKALGYYDGSNFPEVWDMNPVNQKQFDTDWANSDIFQQSIYFHINKPSENLDHLLSNIPQSDVSGMYAGILGHNFKDIGVGFSLMDQYYDSVNAMASYNDTDNNIINVIPHGTSTSHFGNQYNGYSLLNITDFGGDDFTSTTDRKIGKIKLHLSTETLSGGTIPSIGAATFGRWFQPEFSFDLKGTIANNYEGVNVQNTVGGSTLSNIKHLGQPNWGELPAWTLEKQVGHDYKIGGAKGRRSWEVGFSYLTDDNLFNKAGNPDKFFTYDEDTEQYTFDTSLGSFLKLTLNGKLPFIFCPDSSADDLEFALCRVTNQPSFSQVANNLFSTSLTITETW